MSDAFEIRNRPSAAPAPSLCLALDLQRVWDVQADHTYDVVCDRPERQLVTIWTLGGTGELMVEGHRPVSLVSNSVITIELTRIRRYRCLGDQWNFRWFEYTLTDVFPAAINTPCRISFRDADLVLFNELFVKIQHPAAPERHIASAAFALMLQRWIAESRLRNAPSPHQRVIETVINRIRGDLSANWTLPRLASEAGLCETLFRREFKKVTGVAPAQFILQARLHAAVLMIRQGVYSLAGIATQLNFSSAFHLSTAFKKQYGVSPSQWH